MSNTPTSRHRLDTATAANLLLVTFLILYVILPDPWGGIAGAAAVASLAAMFVARYVWPKPEPEPEPEPTAREAMTQMTASVRDMLKGFQVAGFTEDEAKQMVRDQLMAQQPKTSNLRPMNGGKTS